uniref:Maturation protein n=1 Tax=Riiser virus TaxID=2707256 RepID=A0A6H0DIU6_9VIRU|nr:MAG: hypothetical protein [Riiser virus]
MSILVSDKPAQVVLTPRSTKSWPEFKSPLHSARPPFTIDGVKPLIGQSPLDRWKDDSKSRKGESFKKIRQSGEIKMTPYRVGYRESSFRESTVHCRRVIFYHRYDSDTWQYDTEVATASVRFGMEALNDLPPTTPTENYGGIHLNEVASTRAELRNAVRSELASTYDVLTELAEMGETIHFLVTAVKKAARPLQTIAELSKNARRKGASKEAHSTVTQKWMEYRYAIGPLLYSIADIQKLLEEKDNIYTTARKSSTVVTQGISADVLRSVRQTQVCIITQGGVNLRACGKTRYTAEGLARLADQISFNPLKTSWELIPYSFVIDWVLNVGDWLESISRLDFARQRVFSESVKQVITEDTYLVTYDPARELRWGSGDHTYRMHVGDNTQYHHLKRVKEDSYDRNLFEPEVELKLSDQILTWKRSIDAYVLSLRPLLSVLRRLK